MISQSGGADLEVGGLDGVIGGGLGVGGGDQESSWTR